MNITPLFSEHPMLLSKKETAPIYTEPAKTNETVYEDEKYCLTRIWKWRISSLYEDRETGYLRVLLDGSSFKGFSHSTYATADGERLTPFSFDKTGDFSEGLAPVGINGKGYGYIDKNMRFVIPLGYDFAGDFENGIAPAVIGERKFFIDRSGNELPSPLLDALQKYSSVGAYAEDTVRASTLSLTAFDLADHTVYDGLAGTWGYVDKSGEEIISPRFVYACDFYNGIAVAAEGQWKKLTYKEDKENAGLYRAVNVRWGAIDREGNTVLPFIYDSIQRFDNGRTDIFAVYSSQENGWSIVDSKGNRLNDTAFEGIEAETFDNLVIFSQTTDEGETLMGVYNIKEKRTAIPPIYSSLHLLKNGYINAETYDKRLGRTVERIIDRGGKERFPSEYSYINTWKEPYETVIRTEEGEWHGVIEPNGKVLIPCIYSIPFDGFRRIKDRIVFEENGLMGVKSIVGDTEVPPRYYDIPRQRGILYAATKEHENGEIRYGIVTPEGSEALPFEYEAFYPYSDGRHVFLTKNGVCEAFLMEEK